MPTLLAAAVVAPLLALASALSGLPVPADAPPALVLLTDQAFGERLGWTENHAIGVTSLSTGYIYVYPGWREGDGDTCVLVHELTHWLQVVNRVEIHPIARLEVQAYDVTAKCYARRGEKQRAIVALHQKAAAEKEAASDQLSR